MHAAMKCAETFHCEVEDLVDMEETTEDVNQKPKWRFDLEEKDRMLAQSGQVRCG